MADRSESTSVATDRLLELKITSDPANYAPTRKTIEAFCRAHGLSDRDSDEIGLCFNEAIANITRHAYAGKTDKPVLVRAIDSNTDLSVSIRDWGNGVNPAKLPVKPKDPLKPGGLGLICLREMLDELRFDSQPDGMLVTMVKKKAKMAG
jgi:serine/threonine-protein kinase RsbW